MNEFSYFLAVIILISKHSSLMSLSLFCHSIFFFTLCSSQFLPGGCSRFISLFWNYSEAG